MGTTSACKFKPVYRYGSFISFRVNNYLPHNNYNISMQNIGNYIAFWRGGDIRLQCNLDNSFNLWAAWWRCGEPCWCEVDACLQFAPGCKRTSCIFGLQKTQMKLVTLYDLNLKDGVVPKYRCSRRYEIPHWCQSGRNMFVLVVDCNRTISHTALKCFVCFIMSAQKLDILFLAAIYIVTSLK